MSRVEHLSDTVTLHLGDCREILPSVGKVDAVANNAANLLRLSAHPATWPGWMTQEAREKVATKIDDINSIAVVTDPPYGIAYTSGGGGRFTAPHGHSYNVGKRSWGEKTVRGDDGEFDPTFLLECPAVHRILWGANNYASLLPNREGWLFWDKYCAESNLTFAEGEFAWTDLDRTARAFRHLWNGVCKDSETGQARIHPTQKPIALMTWCLRLLPDSVHTILDPFMGSGTTGVACVQLGRKFIGIEIESKYFDIACRRIADELRRPRLPLEERKPVVQEVMAI